MEIKPECIVKIRGVPWEDIFHRIEEIFHETTKDVDNLYAYVKAHRAIAHLLNTEELKNKETWYGKAKITTIGDNPTIGDDIGRAIYVTNIISRMIITKRGA